MSSVAADQVADQKIAAMKIFEILVHHEADVQVALRLALVFRRYFLHRLGKHGVGGAVADAADQVLFDARQRPRLADGRAALRNHAGQRHFAAHRNGHAAVCKNFAVQINLRERFGKTAAGEAAIDRHCGITFVPRSQPAFRVEMKRINEGQPAVHVFFCDAGFDRPVIFRARRLDVFLRETDALQFRARQGIQREHQPAGVFNFFRVGDQPGAGTARQQRNPCVNPENLQNRLRVRIPLLAGCSSTGLVANAEEIENAGGLVLALYSLPGAKLKGVRFTQENIESAGAEHYWPVETGVAKKDVNGWLAFVDPFHLDSESWLTSWNESYAAVPVYGGLASGSFSEQFTQVYLDGEVFEDGGVAIAVGGEVTLTGVVSQGCTPIGEAWTLTRVEQNLIRHIGNRPAYAVLSETVQKLSPEDQRKAQGNLHIGLVVNEYLEDFQRGDFLIRNLIGGDPNSGVLAVGALPRMGQTCLLYTSPS